MVIPEGPMCSQGKGYQTLVAGVQLDNDSGQLQRWDSRSALGSLRPRAVVGGQGDSHSVTVNPPRSVFQSEFTGCLVSRSGTETNS